MLCIFCNKQTKVVNSRSSKKSYSKWRRRQCDRCNSLFSTLERPDLKRTIKVRDRSGKFKPFSEDKLFISLYECLSHRNNVLEASRSLAEFITSKLLPVERINFATAEEIAREAYKALKRFDSVAAVYYKAHHL